MLSSEDPEWRRISEHLGCALELTDSERERYLVGLERDHPEIVRQLRSLLGAAAENRFPQFLSGAAPFAAEAAASATFIGRQVGPYLIEAEIGHGGMGSVWLARRADGQFEGQVAIKFIHPVWLGRTGEQRFRLEGRLLAQLDHPNITRLLDAGLLEGMQPYLVLEYVEGEPIDSHCERGCLGIAARIALFLDVLAAVAHAHSHLVVHRDLKPSNVLVTRQGAVKLLDFGIAKLLDPGAMLGDVTALSREGGRMLTPEFAAPEQLLGGAVTTGTDIYALGVLLYILLSGRHPAGEKTRSPAELTKAIVESEAPRLSEVVADAMTRAPVGLTDIAAKRATSPAKLRRLLQGDLDNIVAKALKKDPQQRYPSVGAFADDLNHFLHDEPVSARADSVVYRTSKFVQRHRGAVTAGVMACIATIAGLLGTITQAQRADQHALRAQHERDVALRELTYAEATDEFMRFLLSESSSKPFTTSELLARAEKLVDQQFAGDAEVRARLQLTIADLYGEAIDFKNAEAVLLQAQRSALAGNDVSLRAQVDCTLAGLYSAVGQLDRAPALLDDSIMRLKGAAEPQSAAIADCLNERALHNRDRGDAKGALADAQAALQYLGSPRPGQRAMAADLRTSLGDSYGMLGDYPQAIRSYELALDDLASMGREHTTTALTLANNLGVHLSRAGQVLRSATVYKRALDNAPAAEAVTRHLLGTNYAKVLVELGRTQEALQLFEDALSSATASGNTRAIAFTSLYASSAWCAQGDLTRCGDLLRSSRETLRAVLPADHYVFGIVEMTAATLASARHDLVTARDDLLRAVAIFDAAAEKSPARIRALSLLARTEQELGEDRAARDDAIRAVASAREVSKGFTQSEWLGSALLATGIVQQAQGSKSAAQATLREALMQLQATVGEAGPAAREARALLAGL